MSVTFRGKICEKNENFLSPEKNENTEEKLFGKMLTGFVHQMVKSNYLQPESLFVLILVTPVDKKSSSHHSNFLVGSVILKTHLFSQLSNKPLTVNICCETIKQAVSFSVLSNL